MTSPDLSQGSALMLWRRSLRMTQAELARALGRSRWSIVQYELGRQPVPKSVLLALKELNRSMRKTDVQPTLGRTA